MAADTPPTAPSPRIRLPSSIWALGFVSLFMDISSEMIHALLPIYLVTVLGASTLTIGFIEGIAEATANITKIFSGALSDWLGHRKLLTTLGYGLAAFTKPIFPLAATVGWVVAARLIDRIGKGIRDAPRDALVADLAPPHLRGASFGLRQALDTVGAFAGPLVAITLMALTSDDFCFVFWIAVVPAFIALAVMLVAVKEPVRHAADVKPRFQLTDMKRLSGSFWNVVGVATILTLARFSDAFLILRSQDVGLSVTLTPAVMVVMNIVYALAAYPAGALSDRIGRSGLLALGMVCLVAADLVLALGTSVVFAMLGVVFWGLHMALTQGLFASLIADTAPQDLRGTAFGVFNFAGGIAMLVASVLAGGLWDAYGPTATIVNVALPDIMGAFGMGQDKAQLLSTGFLAAMTGTMLLNAWMVETLGQRATFMLAVVVFIVASVMGGLAPAEGVLILARVLQGGAAGILQPLAMQVIFQVFPPEKRGSAMGIYGIGVVLAPALGPTLGGIMVDNFSWRYVFFMAVPFCLIGLFLATLFIPGRASSGPPRRFDWIGFGLMTVFLVTLLNGLSNGQREEWFSDFILGSFAIALVSGIGFIVWELRSPAPMLNLKLFMNRVYAGASVVAFIFGAGIYGSTFLIPLFVQAIQGYTPTRSGLLLMPAGLILAIVFPIAGRLTDRTPAYATVMFGLAVFALSSFLMTGVDTDTSFWLFAWWIMLGRIGLGFIMPSLNAGALKALPMTLLGQGSGAINFVRQLGGAFGVNLLSIALERRSQLYVDSFTAAQHAANSATAGLLRDVTALLAQAGVPEAIRQAGAMNYLGRMIYTQGNMLGYRDSFFIVGAIFLAALLPALMMRQGAARPALQAPLRES